MLMMLRHTGMYTPDMSPSLPLLLGSMAAGKALLPSGDGGIVKGGQPSNSRDVLWVGRSRAVDGESCH